MLARAIVTGLCLSLAAATASAAPLDGKTFKIKVTEPGKKSGPDKLIFTGGKLTSTDCTKYGFGASPYKAVKTAAGVRFTAQPTSAKEGRLIWSGTVTGAKVSGTMRWVKKGQRDIKYVFSGKLQR